MREVNMSLPDTYTDKNDTGCCAVPNIKDWDKKRVVFRDKHFIRMSTKSFLHIPLNMASVMKKLNETAVSSGRAMPPRQAMILSRDMSNWKADQLYAVTGEIEGADNVVLNGDFLTMVFEGPYQNAKQWYDQLLDFVKEKGCKSDEVYFFYTTCPKCAKHYGKNYTIGLAKIS